MAKTRKRSRSLEAAGTKAEPTVAVQIRIPREWIGTDEEPGPLRIAYTEDRRKVSEWIRLAVADELTRRGYLPEVSLG